MLFTLLTYLMWPLALPVLLLHPKLRSGLRERLGLHRAGWPGLDSASPRVWLHGASAGDVAALLPLARALRQREPTAQIILSTITNTGRAMAHREHELFSAVTYLPFDLPGCVRRSLARVRPHAVVLEYTELWPHFIQHSSRSGAAVVLHNGRFSRRRLGRYRALFSLAGNLLEPMRLLLMRDEDEAERARGLGANPATVHVTGNTKFDGPPHQPSNENVAAMQRELGIPANTALWVAGSTHDGEEELLLTAFSTLREHHPQLRLLIAPRYVDRADRVLAQCKRHNFKACRRTAADGGDWDVLVLDTIGELDTCYRLADLVFVGGSFVRRGGHNIIEPAASGKPVLFGPHMDNVGDSVQALLGRGGVQVTSAAQLETAVHDLLVHHDNRRELGELARERVLALRGAAQRNADLILAEIA